MSSVFKLANKLLVPNKVPEIFADEKRGDAETSFFLGASLGTDYLFSSSVGYLGGYLGPKEALDVIENLLALDPKRPGLFGIVLLSSSFFSVVSAFAVPANKEPNKKFEGGKLLNRDGAVFFYYYLVS